MAVSIVQFTKGSANSSAVFGSAPTNGNYLVAINGKDDANSTASGWTKALSVINTPSFDPELRSAVYWKLCGAGESTTQSPTTGGGQVGIWEIAGFVGTWASDVIFDGDGDGNGAYPFAHATGPSGVDCVALIGVSERDNSDSPLTGPSISTPAVTSDGQQMGSGDTRFASAWGHNVTTASTSINPTATFDASTGWKGYLAVLIPKGSSDTLEALDQATATLTSYAMTESGNVLEALAQATLTLTSYGVGDASVFEALAHATITLTAYAAGEKINVFEALDQATVALTSYTLVEGFLAIEPLTQAAILLTSYNLQTQINDLALKYTHGLSPQPTITDPALERVRNDPATLYYDA